MKEEVSKKVKEGWSGPGRRDSVITPLTPQDDGLHIDIYKKKMYEWWYFDAHLDSGHTIVAFFYASNANPGPTSGKAGVELVLLRPDGRKTQKFIEYPKSAFEASTEKADVKVGKNRLKLDYSKGDLPVYTIHLDEKELGFDLTYTAEVKGWKPGTGFSHFGEMGYFAWVVPFAKASVKGTIRDGSNKLSVNGVGYHDHNWLNFSFQSIIDYWMWGRIYSKSFTVCFAFIQCNEKVDRHAVKVLMLARGRNPVLSTGDFEFIKEDFEYSPKAKHSYPRSLTIRVPGEMEVRMKVEKVLEEEDMLDRFGSLIRFFAKHFLRIKPGYFRLQSAFELDVEQEGKTHKEKGSTLHEVVLFKSAERPR
nr:lipocalin-like domain-containing protein [Candidatus Njordarchaeum guaymaensis]